MKRPALTAAFRMFAVTTILEARKDAKIGARLLARPVERLHIAGAGASTLYLRHHVYEHALTDRQAPAPVDTLVAALALCWLPYHRQEKPPTAQT